MFSCRCSSKARYAVAAKDAVLDSETKDVQLLVVVLVCAFEKTLMGCGKFARAVVSPAGQDMIREAKMGHTLLLLELVLAEGERDVCPFWIRLLDMNCL